MLFSSITFLYYFLPAVLVVYFAVPNRFKNAVLLAASVVFYFFGEPVYCFLMLGMSLAGWLFGLWIMRARGAKTAKLPLVLGVVALLIPLGFFKYSDFLIANINGIFGSGASFLRLALPIGISFYTFQILSYLVDVYRGDAQAQKNFLDFAAYVCLFPQLVAGPIVRYVDVAKALNSRKFSWEQTAAGVGRFVAGLAKKVLLANTLGEIGQAFAESGDKSVLFYYLAAISFMLHIYFDFSGYSDMAIGLGKVFGFEFLENFNYPYVSKSVTEFWRRWHISLGSWFRDYVYIPLGGSRKGRMRTFVNILIVWALTGLWHGAEWNFVVWGLYFAFFLMLEKLFLGKILGKSALLSRLYTLAVVMFGFVIFNSADMGDAVQNLGGMFGAGGIPFASAEAVYYLRSYLVVLVLSIFAATPFAKNLFYKIKAAPRGEKVLAVLQPVGVVALMVLVTAYLVDGSFNPFLYFRF